MQSYHLIVDNFLLRKKFFPGSYKSCWIGKELSVDFQYLGSEFLKVFLNIFILLHNLNLFDQNEICNESLHIAYI